MGGAFGQVGPGPGFQDAQLQVSRMETVCEANPKVHRQDSPVHIEHQGTGLEDTTAPSSPVSLLAASPDS